jgi:hypothetical protein
MRVQERTRNLKRSINNGLFFPGLTKAQDSGIKPKGAYPANRMSW